MTPTRRTSSDAHWFKSSYSGGAGSDCVEVAFTGSVTSARDSKTPQRGVLSVRDSAFTVFIEGIKTGVAHRPSSVV
jgi:hypothetical protein